MEYEPGADLGLDMHTDDSDVTFNICLGREFTGAALEFCGKFGTTSHRQHKYTHHHVIGSAVVHSGRQRHGAQSILTGKRANLVIWNKSLAFRSLEKSRNLRKFYAKEGNAPDLVCLSKTHDRDFEAYGPGGGVASSSQGGGSGKRSRESSKEPGALPPERSTTRAL